MSLNAASIRIMADKGLSALDIAEIAEAMEVRRDPTAAERQQRHRDKVKAERDDVTRDVTRDCVTEGPAPDKSPPDPQKLTPTPPVRETRARGDYHRLPEGWMPKRQLPLKTQAKVDQWPPGALDDELAAMHRWAANAKNEAGKGRKLDWDKAWVNWIERRDDEQYRRARGNGMGRHQPSDGLSATRRAAIRAFGPPGAGEQRSAPG